jgi:hypothetical protein
MNIAHDDELSVLWMTTTAAAATVGPVAVTSIAGALTPAIVEHLFHLFDDQRARWREHYVSVVLVKARTPLPDDATRERLAELVRSGRTGAIVFVVVDADGFWAAAARGVLASLALVSRRAPTPARTIEDALASAATRLPAPVPDLVRFAPAIRAFRDRHLAGT